MSKSTNLVGERFGPNGNVRSFDEVTMFLDLAGDWVDNGVGFLAGCCREIVELGMVGTGARAKWISMCLALG